MTQSLAVSALLSPYCRTRATSKLDKFFKIQSNSENIWERRAKELLAYILDIPADALRSWESLTRCLTGRYVPGFTPSGVPPNGGPTEGPSWRGLAPMAESLA